jgi:putative hydrolase of HD superfamily
METNPAEKRLPDDDILQSIFRFDLLTRLPRTGFLMRGIDKPESIAEHCFMASVLAALLIPEIRKEGHTLDGEKLLSMVILHEAGEILLGDIPAPAAIFFGKAGKSKAEREAAEAVMREHPENAAIVDEFEEGKSLEARIARAIDKLQLIVRVLKYESEGKGALAEFWDFDGNFPMSGVKAVDRLFNRVREVRGKFHLDYLGMVKLQKERLDQS